MNYGWVLSAPNGTRLAYDAGNCQGRESSLRAEATGMLSAYIFMAMIQHYQAHQQQQNADHHQLKVQYVSNNLELINRGK